MKINLSGLEREGSCIIPSGPKLFIYYYLSFDICSKLHEKHLSCDDMQQFIKILVTGRDERICILLQTEVTEFVENICAYI